MVQPPTSPSSLLWAYQLKREHAHLLARIRDLETTTTEHTTHLSKNDNTTSPEPLATAAEITTLTARLTSLEDKTKPLHSNSLQQQQQQQQQQQHQQALTKLFDTLSENLSQAQTNAEAMCLQFAALEKKFALLESDRTKAFEREKAAVRKFGELEAGLKEVRSVLGGFEDVLAGDRLGVLEGEVRGLREVGRGRDELFKGLSERVKGMELDFEGVGGRIGVVEGEVLGLVTWVEKEERERRVERDEHRVTQSSGPCIMSAGGLAAGNVVPRPEIFSVSEQSVCDETRVPNVGNVAPRPAMVSGDEHVISNETNATQMIDALVADDHAEPQQAKSVPACTRKGAPPRSKAKGPGNRVQNISIKPAATQTATKASPVAPKHATRAAPKTAEQPLHRTLTFEALKDHDQQNPPLNAGSRKRKAPASTATTRVTRSQARARANPVLEQEPEPPSLLVPSRQAAARSPAPRKAQPAVRKAKIQATQVSGAPALWPTVENHPQPAVVDAPVQPPPKKKDGRRFIALD
ncbi:hypothetical protein MBLNU230_g3783t1 [Neophaeotheca triangularis]